MVVRAVKRLAPALLMALVAAPAMVGMLISIEILAASLRPNPINEAAVICQREKNASHRCRYRGEASSTPVVRRCTRVPCVRCVHFVCLCLCVRQARARTHAA